MNETDPFLPEVPLRFLGYNKRLGKTSPPPDALLAFIKYLYMCENPKPIGQCPF